MKPEAETGANPSPPEDDPSWQLWGPYMSNREWGTVRETGAREGLNWSEFPYERAGQTAYRHCEDGIFGVCDRECRVCHSYAFWNYRDDHLKERFFGVTNGQGAHGEDVKEMYYHRAADPLYRYLCAEYLYPQTEFAYRHLVNIESTLRQQARSQNSDVGSEAVSQTGFDHWHREQRYFEIEFEMSKLTPEQLYFQLSITNCANEAARLVAVPMLFLRNMHHHSGDPIVKRVVKSEEGRLVVVLKDADGNETQFSYYYDTEAGTPEILLTNNNSREGGGGGGRHFKDSFNAYIVRGDGSELMSNVAGSEASKAGICYRLKLGPKQQVKLRGFLMTQRSGQSTALNWPGLTSNIEMMRLQNLVDTYQSLPTNLLPTEQDILNAAYVGLLWNRQYYPLDRMPHLWTPQSGELPTRLVTVPDKWEQPYLATWDAALHCLCLSCFDLRQALNELMLLLALIRPDGSIFTDEYRPNGVTPPLIVLSAIDVYGKCSPEEKLSLGPRIYSCLKGHLHWWLNRKDALGVALIDGGVCGVDYVSLFPRELLETGEGLIWAMFFTMRFLELSLAIYVTPGCTIVLAIEQDLPIIIGYLGRLCAVFVRSVAQENGLFHPCWLDVTAVSAVRNSNGDANDADDDLRDLLGGGSSRLRRNSSASFTSLDTVDGSQVSFSGFVDGGGGGASGGGGGGVGGEQKQRCDWLHAYCYLPIICCCSLPNVRLQQRGAAGSPDTLEDLFATAFNGPSDWETRAPYIYTDGDHERLFVSALNSLQLAELLEQLLSEIQFLSQFGIRTMSLMHTCDEAVARVTPSDAAELASGSFRRQRQQEPGILSQRFCSGASVGNAYGGNTNWYGAVNLPYNYLVLEAMHKWSTVLDRKFDLIEYPSYTGRFRRLKDIVQDLASRNVALFLPNAYGVLPSTGTEDKRGILLYETFDGDSGRGHGASHKSGWSAIIARILLLMHDIN